MKKVLKIVAAVAFVAGVLSALKIWAYKKTNEPDIFDEDDDDEELWEEE